MAYDNVIAHANALYYQSLFFYLISKCNIAGITKRNGHSHRKATDSGARHTTEVTANSRPGPDV